MQMPEPSALSVLSWVARGRAVARRRSPEEAADSLVSARAPSEAQRVFKAAVGAGSTTSSTLGPGLVEIGAFSNAMRTASAFFRILSDNGFARLPLETRVGLITSSPTASTVAEGAAIPVSCVVFNNITLAPIRVSELIVLTDSLLLNLGAGAQATLSRELQSVLAAGVDAAFVVAITDGITPTSSISPTQDLRRMLLAVSTSGTLARPYFLAAEDTAAMAATLNAAAGPAFATAGPAGGELLLANVPMIVSTGVPSGTLVLVNAAGIAADGGPITIDASTEADISMLDNPTMSGSVPTATNVTSMFTTDSTALRAGVIFGAARIRSNAVAITNAITTTTWATT